MDQIQQLIALQNNLESCLPLFVALSDEVRLAILTTLYHHAFMYPEHPSLNVTEITRETNLSRPAISHHLKILKDAGLVDLSREGTANHYYLTIDEGAAKLIQFAQCLKVIIV